jgi:ribose 5-phosphate isomerase B
MVTERIAVAADHAGADLKAALSEVLRERGYEVLDLGTNGPESVDYPDFAAKLAAALAEGQASRGVLVCGTGIGISIAANRYPHIRAALCHGVTDARLARQHNDANVLALGARTTGVEIARECLEAFLDTAFEGGRHQRRIDKMS